MTGAALALLAAIGLALFAAAAVAPFAPAVTRLATPALSALGALVSLVALVAGGDAATLSVPVGLPGLGMALALDPLSAVFLLLVFTTAVAASLCTIGDRTAEGALLPVLIGAMALTLLGADAFALVLGFALMALASWGLVAAVSTVPETGSTAAPYLGLALLGVVSLAAASGLLAPEVGGSPAFGFAAMRDVAPQGWAAASVLVLALLGTAPIVGLVPWHIALLRAHAAAPPHAAALLSGATTKVALYVLIRILFDLCGTAQPAWWGVPLLVLGATSAVIGAMRATVETDLKSVLIAGATGQVGLIAIGLGVALLARGADLPALAAFALAASLLAILTQGSTKALLLLAAAAVGRGAGTRHLDRLGGLIHRMPATSLCALAGTASLAALPPTGGFASLWMLLQAILGAARSGGLLMQTLLAVVLALAGLSAALAATGALRLIGVAFLGRPRTPRAAAAEEAPRHVRIVMLGLAALSVVPGLLPGPVLRLIAPSVRQVLSVGLDGRAGWFAVVPQAEAPGYAALGVVVLLAACGGGATLLLRRFAVPGARRAPAWNGGFAPAPAWLPFGDPATQYSGAGFAQPLHRSFGPYLLTAAEAEAAPRSARRTLRWLAWQASRLQRLTIRRQLGLAFTTLVLLLVVIAWLDAR